MFEGPESLVLTATGCSRIDETLDMAESRTSLGPLRQGRASPVSSDIDELDDIPVVNPALLTGRVNREDLPMLTVDMVKLVSSSTEFENRWANLLRSLAQREGTVFDITAEMMGYGDQAALTAIRKSKLDVRSNDLVVALADRAEWPILLMVESYLRDGAVVAVDRGTRLAFVKMWCAVVATNVGEEAIRAVALALELWFGFDVRGASCSGNGTEGIAMVSGLRCRAYHEYLWSNVLLALERQSNDVYWDWRRVSGLCHVHITGRCPKSTWPGEHVVTPNPSETEWTDVNAFIVDDESDGDDMEDAVQADVTRGFEPWKRSGIESEWTKETGNKCAERSRRKHFVRNGK